MGSQNLLSAAGTAEVGTAGSQEEGHLGTGILVSEVPHSRP